MRTSSYVLITGVTHGLGRELCTLFAQDGHNLVLVNRPNPDLLPLAEELATTYHIHTLPITQDLLSPTATGEIVKQLTQHGIQVDILVNNAGVGNFGPFWESDGKKELTIIDLNVRALVSLTHALLPDMIASKHGGILMISSLAGFAASPNATTYYASKAFVNAFSLGLRESLKSTGVTLTLACPGPTATNFNWHVRAVQPKKPAHQMAADKTARIIYQGFKSKKALVVPGTKNKIAHYLTRLLPQPLVIQQIHRSQKKHL